MGKARKKTLHLGVKPIGGPSLKSRRVARKVTTQYHVLIQQKSAIQANKALSREEKAQQLREIEDRLADAGGIDRYQQASVISTKHFSTSKWIVQAIRRLRPAWSSTSGEKKQTLEVGAINTQLHSAPFLSVRSIDLHSQHPLIEERDFFDIEPERAYDVVVCSMVINYVTDPKRRAEMVARLCMHLRSEDSVLFLILPKRCLSSPFFTSHDDFLALLQVVFGLRLLEAPHSTPKVAFFVLQLPLPGWRVQSTSLPWRDWVRSHIEHNVVEHQADLASARRRWQVMLRPSSPPPSRTPVARGAEDKSQSSAEDFSIVLCPSLCTAKCVQALKQALG